MYDWDNSGGQKNRGGVRRSQTGVWSSDYECGWGEKLRDSAPCVICPPRGLWGQQIHFHQRYNLLRRNHLRTGQAHLTANPKLAMLHMA